MKRILLIILAVVAVFVLIRVTLAGMASRSASRSLAPAFGMGGGAAPEAPAMEAAPPEPAYDQASNSVKSAEFYNSQSSPVLQERMVIQNADLAIVVVDPKARMTEISELASDLGGYVVSSNLFQSYTTLGKEVPEASIVVRVPLKY